MLKNRGLSDWNGINSEIENEKTVSSDYDRSGLTVESSEASLIDGAKAPKAGSVNSRDFLPVAAAPDRPESEAVSALHSFFPTMSLEEAASVMRNDLSFNSQGWGALRSPILDLITGKACFSLGSALVSGIVANCGMNPQTVGSIEDVYWKAVGDDLSKWKNATREVYQKAVEFPSQFFERTKEKYSDLRDRFQGVDFVLSAFGADMGFPIFTRDKGWLNGSPTVDFSTTLTGCNFRVNFEGSSKPKMSEFGGVNSDQLTGTVSVNASVLRYFGMSFNGNDSLASTLFGYTVALPYYNPSISADNATRRLSDYGTAVGNELDRINRHFVKRIEHILYER